MLTPRHDGASTDESGFSLIELLVVMLVGSVMLVLASRGFLQSFHNTADAQDRSEATVRTQNALEAISRDIRIADPVLSGGPTALSVQQIKNDRCSRRTWTVNATTTTIDMTTDFYSTSDCTGAVSTTSTGTLLTGILTTTTPFRYLDAAGAPTTATSAVAVQVEFTRTTAGAQPVILRTVAQVRNKT